MRYFAFFIPCAFPPNGVVDSLPTAPLPGVADMTRGPDCRKVPWGVPVFYLQLSKSVVGRFIMCFLRISIGM